jgi:hypothetical protein
MEIIKVSFIALVTSLVVVLLTGMTHASDVDTRVDPLTRDHGLPTAQVRVMVPAQFTSALSHSIME